MEPLTLIASLGIAFARGAAGRAGSLLSTDEVGHRLSSIETTLAKMATDPHTEPLRQGIALLRHAADDGNPDERQRRQSVAEDHLITAADDPALSNDDRAAASLLLAAISRDREAAPRSAMWLWRANGFLSSHVNECLYFALAIMADDAPVVVRQDLLKQEKSSWLGRILGTFTPRTAHLRALMLDRARDVLPVWESVRSSLAQLHPELQFPVPSITDEVGLPPVVKDDPGSWQIEYRTARGSRVVGGSVILSVDQADIGNSGVVVLGTLQSLLGVPAYRSKSEGYWPTAGVSWVPNGFPTVRQDGRRVIGLHTHLDAENLNEGVAFHIHRPFDDGVDHVLRGHVDEVRLSTPEGVFCLVLIAR